MASKTGLLMRVRRQPLAAIGVALLSGVCGLCGVCSLAGSAGSGAVGFDGAVDGAECGALVWDR